MADLVLVCFLYLVCSADMVCQAISVPFKARCGFETVGIEMVGDYTKRRHWAKHAND
jgi:hypothetical protein